MERINRTLLELWLGILLFGLLCQGVGVFLVRDKPGYSIGLWLGVLMALASAYHMWKALDVSLGLGEKEAAAAVQRKSLLRYAAQAAGLVLIMVSGFANPLSAFLGLMGLKAGAYIQPFTHKLISRFLREEIDEG